MGLGQPRPCAFLAAAAKYTIAAEAEYRNQDFEDMMPWLRAALSSIRPLH
jgi:hypothetical protein